MRKNFYAVVATDENWGIGFEGNLLAHVSADMKHFRELTCGKTVILGRKTLETFPGGKPLPKRRNVIMSRSNLSVEGADVAHSEKELLRMVRNEAAVIGGAEIYSLLLPYCKKVYITKFHHEFQCDKFFPNLDISEEWILTGIIDSFVASETDSNPGMKCDLLLYERKV